MERFTKAFATILTIILLIVCISIPVNAYSATASLTTTSKLTAGDTVTVNFNLSNLDVGSGIDALEAKLEYDKSILETSEDQIVGANSWKVQGYNADTNKFTALRNNLFTTAGNVITITFKVKSGISATSTKVSLTGIVVSGGTETSDIPVESASVTIEASTTNTDQTPTPTPTPSPTPLPTTTTKENTAVKDNTKTKNTALPKAGVNSIIVLVIVAVAIIAMFSYIIYKRIAKDVK